MPAEPPSDDTPDDETTPPDEGCCCDARGVSPAIHADPEPTMSLGVVALVSEEAASAFSRGLPTDHPPPNARA